MEWERLSIDELELVLVASRQAQSRLNAQDLEVLEELDRRQVATGDGCKSLSEWVAARLDLSLDTAKSLVRTMRRTAQRLDLRMLLASGEVSFDRVEALSRISGDVGLLCHLDVAGVQVEAAKRVRITAEDESRSADDQFLVMQPSLDESWWKFWGGLDGHSGALVDKVLTEAADQLPALPDGSRGDSSWRKATALVELCVNDDPPPAQVTVFVDSKEAAENNGETGVVLESGPRVGRQALEAVLCDATVEVTARAEDGEPMRYGRSQRTAPPALRRALIHAQGRVCAAYGCTSRYRLQVHHLNSWAKGGETNPKDLVVLCWFHHQVVTTSEASASTDTPTTGGSGSALPTNPPDPHPPEHRGGLITGHPAPNTSQVTPNSKTDPTTRRKRPSAPEACPWQSGDPPSGRRRHLQPGDQHLAANREMTRWRRRPGRDGSTPPRDGHRGSPPPGPPG